MNSQTAPHLLIVDDDEAICKTLSAILKSEGYLTTTATTAIEAIEKTKNNFFNVALLDIKLPDMEGTKLLAQLQATTPETIKIMITGYPSLKNAIEALNLGADSYIMKPIDPAELLETIKNKLETQQQGEKVTKEKLIKWVQMQTRKRQSTDFANFLEETANELTEFGLTKNQAKTYITITALGLASASEVAALSKIRREEIYRILPELEKSGIITKKLKTPRKFSATQPELTIQLLVKNKLKTMKEEIDTLKQKQGSLTSKLNAIKLPTKQSNNDCSVEVIYQQQVSTKLTEIAQNAKKHLDIIAPPEDLKLVYINRPRNLMEKVLKNIKIRVITEKRELDALIKEIIQFSKAHNNPIELEQIEKPPFKLIIRDDKEAMWSEFQPKNENSQTFWTDDFTQIAILKTSFESLWQKTTTKNRQTPKS